jgi:hypothetical protein
MCFFGLYAGTAPELTVTSLADAIIAGEYEAGLVAGADGRDPGPAVQAPHPVACRTATGCRTWAATPAWPSPANSDWSAPSPPAAVLADVDHLVAAGARHLSFADPDFLNAPTTPAASWPPSTVATPT